MSSQTPVLIGTLLLVSFALLSFIDGVYLHLWKYRLQERPESRYEHGTHTIRALLFIPILALVYGINAGGWLLWVAIAFLGADLLVEAADVLSERESRSWQGGLREGEYLLHLVLTTVRVASLSLFLASKPHDAWSLSAPLVLSSGYPRITEWIAWNMMPGALLVAALHVFLVLRPMLVSRAVAELSLVSECPCFERKC